MPPNSSQASSIPISLRFPAQETAGGDAKIPTIMYYDKSGKVRAAGAEALDESLVTTAEDEGWIKCSRYVEILSILSTVYVLKFNQIQATYASEMGGHKGNK